jgi:hypothetical protein
MRARTSRSYRRTQAARRASPTPRRVELRRCVELRPLGHAVDVPGDSLGRQRNSLVPWPRHRPVDGSSHCEAPLLKWRTWCSGGREHREVIDHTLTRSHAGGIDVGASPPRTLVRSVALRFLLWALGSVAVRSRSMRTICQCPLDSSGPRLIVLVSRPCGMCGVTRLTLASSGRRRRFGVSATGRPGCGPGVLGVTRA